MPCGLATQRIPTDLEVSPMLPPPPHEIMGQALGLTTPEIQKIRYPSNILLVLLLYTTYSALYYMLWL